MKTIKLNISERLFAIKMLNEFKGALEVLSIILEDIKKFAIIDEDWNRAEREIITDGDNVSWKWNDERGGEKNIEIQKETVKYLQNKITEKNDKGEFTLADKSAISLEAKLK